MHIQEATNTTLTTCSKMTEEVDRRHGVNGNSSSKTASEESPVAASAHSGSGGRLKFFKDGKFILELVRGCARAGERSGWVSVPRKTFWPPAAPHTPPTPPAPVPACASLSVSDDNSSIHSSPWQRDHCWKQPAPRRNLSKELAMYYCRPAALTARAIRAGARAKRRRPHDAAPVEPPRANGLCARNGDAEDVVDGDPGRANPTDRDREKHYHMKLKKPHQYHKLRVYKKTRPAIRPKLLARTIDKLRERVAALPVPVNAKLASCRQEHMMVSPRKRILRELERVSLEDQGTKRRAKTVPALSTASYPPSPSAGAGPSHATARAAAPPDTPPAAARSVNGTARKEPVSKNVSSYSIHSLLSMPDESPRRSPHSYPPSLKTESPSSVHSPDLSPSPDNYRYRYSTLTLGSPTPGPARDSPTPPELARYRAAPYAPPVSPYAGRQWTGGYRREDWRELPYVYGYGYGPGAAGYRAPTAPLWMHYAMAPGIPPGPWAPLAHPLINDHIPKEEPTSDLPLNLSKH